PLATEYPLHVVKDAQSGEGPGRNGLPPMRDIAAWPRRVGGSQNRDAHTIAQSELPYPHVGHMLGRRTCRRIHHDFLQLTFEHSVTLLHLIPNTIDKLGTMRTIIGKAGRRYPVGTKVVYQRCGTWRHRPK